MSVSSWWQWLFAQPEGRQGRWAPLGAAALTVAAQLVFVTLLPSQSGNDSTDFTTFYLPVAQNLAEGRGLITDDGAFAARYPPLFPALLASFLAVLTPLGLETATVVDLFRYLCLAWIGLAVYRLAALELPPRLALTLAGAWAFYPAFLFIGKQPNSELPFLPLWLMAVEWAWRCRRVAVEAASPARQVARWALAAGLAAGLAALCRPIAFALILPWALAVVLDHAWVPRRRWLAVAAFTLGLAVPLIPWNVALAQARGEMTLMSTGGRLSMLDGLTFAAKTSTPPPMPAAALALSRRIQDHRGQLATPGQVLRYLANEPERWAVIQLVAYKAARAWYATDSLRFEGFSLAVQLPLVLVFIWAVGRNRRQGGVAWAWTLWTGSFTLYFWGMTVLVLSILRYLLPVLPLLLITIFLALRPPAPTAPPTDPS